MSQKETIKKVLRYIKKYSFFVICSLVLAVITVALTLYVPILTGNAVDVIVGPGQVNFGKITQILMKIAIAIAITTRCRIPPESSCGYSLSRRSGSGIRTLFRSSSALARAAS